MPGQDPARTRQFDAPFQPKSRMVLEHETQIKGSIMTNEGIQRRTVLTGMAAATGALLPRQAPASETSAFAFEVTRTDAEWRARLSEDAYTILRGGATEQPKSSPLWDETAEGTYCCKGCDLTLFDGYWKVVLDIGWVFFRQCEPYSIITAIDRPSYGEILSGEASPMVAQELTEEELRALDTLAGIQAVCRCCGSHLGHVISNGGTVLYCVNGAAMDFIPAEV